MRPGPQTEEEREHKDDKHSSGRDWLGAHWFILTGSATHTHWDFEESQHSGLLQADDFHPVFPG